MFFRVLLKKSGSRTPRIEVEEMGPSLDLVLRRTHLASDDLMKAATKVPKVVKVSVTFTVVRSLLLSEAIKEHFCLKFWKWLVFFVSQTTFLLVMFWWWWFTYAHAQYYTVSFYTIKNDFQIFRVQGKNYWYISRHTKTSVLTAL